MTWPGLDAHLQVLPHAREVNERLDPGVSQNFCVSDACECGEDHDQCMTRSWFSERSVSAYPTVRAHAVCRRPLPVGGLAVSEATQNRDSMTPACAEDDLLPREDPACDPGAIQSNHVHAGRSRFVLAVEVDLRRLSYGSSGS